MSLKQLSSTCHVSLLAAPDTDHKHKFSLTRLIYLSYVSDSLTTHTRSMAFDPYLPCDVPRQSDGSTQIPSLTGYEPKSVETIVIETEAIEPEDLEQRRIKYRKDV